MFNADDLVKQAVERYKDKLAVACSFGKDSIVVLHMALKYDPNVKVMFNNTGVEFPETIKYKEMMVKKWNLNLIETHPIKSFWECVKDYGIPNIRGKGKLRTPKCCIYCKEKPALNACKEHNIIAEITGLMACESRQRKLTMMRYENNKTTISAKDGVSFCGQRWYAATYNMWRFHPIAYWTEKDVWRYIKDHDIPINPVYTKWDGIYKRCGCLPCTAYLDWNKKLSKTHPKLYLKLKQLQHPTQQTLKTNI